MGNDLKPKQVSEPFYKPGRKGIYANFACGYCDNVFDCIIYAINSGKTKSCTCLRKQNKQGYKHGMDGTKIYSIWSHMKQRCYSPNNTNYKNYGGRGIKVCDRWLNSFANFLEDMSCHPKFLSLDRIDNDGNYCKENCRWATRKEQGNNKRNSRKNKIND